MGVNRGRRPHRSAQQLINRLVQDFARQIPQRNIDAADERDVTHKRMLLVGQHVEVPSNRQRVLPEEHPLSILDAGARHRCRNPRFSIPHQPRVGLDPDQTAVPHDVQIHGLDRGDLDFPACGAAKAWNFARCTPAGSRSDALRKSRRFQFICLPFLFAGLY